MSEQAVQQRPYNRADMIEAAAAAAEEAVEIEEAPAPESEAAPTLSKEDVAGESPEPKRAPDRKLVAPSIREFLRTQEPEAPSALEREIADLRAALDGLAEPASQQELSFEQQMLTKLEALESRFAQQEAADREAREVEEYNNRVRAFREGVIENIKSRESDFPALIALGQEETVFNALVQRTQEGVETSEDEIASEVESGLREVYDKLKAVFESTDSSEDPSTGSEPKTTLSSSMTTSGGETPRPPEDMSRQERIEWAWQRANN